MTADLPVGASPRTSESRARLIEARDLLKRTMQDAEPQNVAGLVKEYRLVLAAIDELPNDEVVNPIDALVARSQGVGAAKVPKSAARKPRDGGKRSD